MRFFNFDYKTFQTLFKRFVNGSAMYNEIDYLIMDIKYLTLNNRCEFLYHIKKDKVYFIFKKKNRKDKFFVKFDKELTIKEISKISDFLIVIRKQLELINIYKGN